MDGQEKSKKQKIMSKMKEIIQKTEFTEMVIWGDNSNGQLGIEKTSGLPVKYVAVPKPCSFNIKVSAIGRTQLGVIVANRIQM